MPIDYSKFDNLEDSDDEAPPAAKKPPTTSQKTASELASSSPVAGSVPEEHRTPLDDAPKLELPEGEFLKYYTEKMTVPQRMQTLIKLWNSAPQEQRVEFLRHLIDLINNPAISNRIKGGQEVLRDLDENYYTGVTFPVAWLEQFKESLTVEDKKVVFEKLFKSLGPSEQGLVLGTLS